MTQNVLMHTNKKMVSFFAALADETRIKIIAALMDSPKTVGGIYSAVGKESLTLSAISHQLRHMSDMDIIRYHKKGREKIFELSGAFCWCIARNAIHHFHEEDKCEICSKIKAKTSKRKH